MHYIWYYKITKIVHALWLVERSVCTRVCKHGCGVKLFGFLHANHASTNLKKFSSSKFDKFTLFTHSFVGWNMENRYKEGESIFLRLSWHFKQENLYFAKHLFAKQELITCARIRGQDFATGKNFSFNQCHTKSFAFFFSGKLFYKSNRKLFSCLCKPLTSSRVCITVSNSPNPSRVYIRLHKHGKRFLLLKI